MDNRRFIIDSIEDGIAKLEAEDLSHIFVSFEDLPPDSREGSVLSQNRDGSFILDKKEESKRRNRILALQKKLQNKKHK